MKVLPGPLGSKGIFHGHAGMLPNLTNALPEDNRAFHLQAGDYEKFQSVIFFEQERVGAIGPQCSIAEMATITLITEGTAKTKGWDKARPRLSSTVRMYMLLGSILTFAVSQGII